MEHIVEMMEYVLENIAVIAKLLFEFIGVAIIIWTGVTGCIKWLSRSRETGVYLDRGFAMGLGFLMGGEILRTVIAREWKEISIVAGLIVLRAALALLLHWEIKQEEKEALKEE